MPPVNGESECVEQCPSSYPFNNNSVCSISCGYAYNVQYDCVSFCAWPQALYIN